MDQNEVIDSVVSILRERPSVLFITGAGLSADSGLPTYRGIGGLYDVETTEEGLPIEEVLSGQMLSSNPTLTWKYLEQIAAALHGASYNRAHQVIAEMERHFPRVWTLTQNVDGFHGAAGSENVIEIHGNLHSLSCTACDYRVHVDDHTELDLPPTCRDCSALLRPDVVLFGEMLPERAMSRLRQQLELGFAIVFSVGTSSLFPYISEPVMMARRAGVPTVEINPGETPVSRSVDYRIPMRAAIALDEIWRRCLD